MENCRDFHKTALDRMARRRPNSTTRPNSLTALHLLEFGSSAQNRCARMNPGLVSAVSTLGVGQARQCGP